MRNEGCPPEGRPTARRGLTFTEGIDDVRNIARLLAHLIAAVGVDRVLEEAENI